MAVEGIVGAVAAAVVLLAVVFGRRIAGSTDSEKLRILSAFDGADVVLGVARGGQVEFIVAQRGRLHVDATDSKGVVLSGRRIVLGQIRWIEDPHTGTRVGDRW